MESGAKKWWIGGGLTAILAVIVAIVLKPTTPEPEDDRVGSPRLVWGEPGQTSRLANGWTLRTTESTLIEVRNDRNELLGNIELGNFTLDAELARHTERSSLEEGLRARAQRLHEVIGREKATLGPGYRYDGATADIVGWGDDPAVRYRARVNDAAGTTVEQLLGYQAVSGGQLWIMSVTGSRDGRPSEGADPLSVEEHEELSRYLSGVLDASPLPDEGSAIEDGMIAATEGGLDGGRLWLISNGQKHPISTPRPLSAQDLQGYDAGERIAQVVVAEQPTSSGFAIVPAGGPDARLHLVVGRRIYEVAVQHVRASVIEALPVLQQPALDRLTVPGP